MKLLVTGVTGFIGGNLAQFADRDGHAVFGIAKSEQPLDCTLRRYIRSDLMDRDVSKLIQDFAPDVIFHGAGPASVASSISAPVDDLRKSILSWAVVLEATRRSGTNPLVLFPSSGAIYGNPVKYPTPENSPVTPISPYGFHKAACELLAREYSDCFKLNIVVLRFFSVFGPRQRSHVIWELYQQLSGENRTVWLRGTGQESRDYIYVDDAVEAILALIRLWSRSPEARKHLIINIGTGRTTRIFEVAEQLKNLTAPQKSVQYRGMPIPGDPEQTCADIRVLRSLLPSWNPRSVTAALTDCVAVWKRQGCSR
jgi:UDP-glucose 4-epimerase